MRPGAAAATRSVMKQPVRKTLLLAAGDSPAGTCQQGCSWLEWQANPLREDIMELSTLLLFVPACFALNLAPGPNNLLSVSNATRHGFRASCGAGLGRLVAFAGMIGLAASGLAAVLHASATLFYAIKLAGALYLFWLAWQLWRAEPVAQGDGEAGRAGFLHLARQEFLVAAGNPKAILIFTAFLPQFVDPARGHVTLQLVLLGGVLSLAALAFNTLLGAFSGQVGRWLQRRPGAARLQHRLLAVAMLGLALRLLMLDRPAPH